MNQPIEVVLDEQGRLVLPFPLSAELGLLVGTTLIVEQSTDEATFLRVQDSESIFADEGGVLVVTSPLVGDIDSVVQDEREKRLKTLLQRNM